MAPFTSIDQINFEILPEMCARGKTAWETIYDEIRPKIYNHRTFRAVIVNTLKRIVKIFGWCGISNNINGEKGKIMVVCRDVKEKGVKVYGQTDWYGEDTKYGRKKTRLQVSISPLYYDLVSEEQRRSFICTIVHELVHVLLFRSKIPSNHKEHCPVFLECGSRIANALGEITIDDIKDEVVKQ